MCNYQDEQSIVDHLEKEIYFVSSLELKTSTARLKEGDSADIDEDINILLVLKCLNAILDYIKEERKPDETLKLDQIEVYIDMYQELKDNSFPIKGTQDFYSAVFNYLHLPLEASLLPTKQNTTKTGIKLGTISLPK